MNTTINVSNGVYESEPYINNADDTESGYMPNQSNAIGFSGVLRLLGAIAVMASLSLFLIEGWSDGNDLSRYFKLLAQTGLITGAGIFLSTVVKEAKGARVFFGLGLVAAVANFTILGALIYSVGALDYAKGAYGSALLWQAVSLTKLIPIAVGSFAVMGILAKFSFSIFARSVANLLTLSFIGLCALLLIPVREAQFVAPLSAFALFAAIRVVVVLWRRDDFAKTREAKFALSTLMLPGSIILFRALGLYAVDDLVLLTLCGSIYYALRCLLTHLSQSGLIKLTMLGLYAAGLSLAFIMASLVTPWLDLAANLVFTILVLAANLDISRQYPTDRSQSEQRAKLSLYSIDIPLLISSLMLGSVNILQTTTTSLLSNQLLGLVGSVALMIMCYYLTGLNRSVASRVGGVLTLSRFIAASSVVICAVRLLFDLAAWFNVGAWAWIGIAGVSLILLGSLHERFGLRFTKSAQPVIDD